MKQLSGDAWRWGFWWWEVGTKTPGSAESKAAGQVAWWLGVESIAPMNYTGWWYTYPSEKYESQLGWWHSQDMET